ncbi:MAG TPA: alpha/beta hydrolase [Chromatiaceae bacterium]|nr:alpha/beta hydrolase [Chromatiaceae bacterium]
MKWLPLLLFLFFDQIQASEVSFKHNGVGLRANLEKAEKWPEGPVVLMTHGTLGHNQMEIISTLQDLFKDNDISSLAINLSLGVNNRKSAMYDCPVTHTHKHTDAIKEISAWVEWLKFEEVKDVILLGHSRGGNQTAWYAAEEIDPVVRKVILIAPQVWSADYADKAYEKRYGKPLKPILDKALALVKAGKGAQAMEHTDFIYCKDTSVTAEAFVNYYQPDERMDTPHLIGKIKQPVLLFVGTEDKVVKGLQKKLEKLPQAGKLTVEVMDGADHFFRDLYAEDLADRAVEFIQEQ